MSGSDDNAERGRDRNGRAVLVWISGAGVLFVLWIVVMAAIVDGLLADGAREGIWRIAIYVLVFQLPMPLAAVAATLVVKLAIRTFNRMLLYYVSVAVVIVCSGVLALILIWGMTWHGMILAAVQLGLLYATWHILRRLWRPHPARMATE